MAFVEELSIDLHATQSVEIERPIELRDEVVLRLTGASGRVQIYMDGWTIERLAEAVDAYRGRASKEAATDAPVTA